MRSCLRGKNVLPVWRSAVKLVQDEMRASQPKFCTLDPAVATTWCLKARGRAWVNPEFLTVAELERQPGVSHTLAMCSTTACEFYVKNWVGLLARKSKVHSELSTAVATGKTRYEEALAVPRCLIVAEPRVLHCLFLSSCR